ncbi:DUF507 family protein [Helicobacter sp. MIT 14-3879]|uniref:DUF507 family protein n=1 Tax=Helicobacter sp. MIT 14-3879 TaxID=2040649 RepID=UPI000E1F7AD5|nr:DUF507 family protein [Helicobacter sp. MIT 14-3879]RDU65577.1 DUF507 domain-containing protein [Helicobacter sp. MIT 14-3879]
MRLKLSHIRYIADKIALDLGNAKFVEILTSSGDIIRIASKYLEEDINAELAIEEKVRVFIDDNIDDIESSGANEKQMFFLIKKKFASESDFILSWDDRYSNLSHKIMDELIDTSIINFKVSEIMIKNIIFKSINSYAKAYKDIEFKVIDRIKNYKKKLLVGTEEYELVFSKMYEEELRKQGFL